jgi:hypothetical protein
MEQSMSSTILTGKRAAAFEKADGQWIYALFERGYESNVYPHQDAWSAVALGSYADVMRRIFGRATSCEGGMLRSKAGSIKPENYIASWQRELARPFTLANRRIELSRSQSFYATVPETQFADVHASLVRAGFEARAEELAAGNLNVFLHADIEILLSIFGNDGPLGVWRILKEYDSGTVQIDVPIPKASKQAMERMPEVRCHAIDDENRLVAIGSAPWRHAGWQYNAVGSFVTEVAYSIEMETPGFAEKAIPAFRDAIRGATSLAATTRITVTRSPEGADEWRVRRADEVAQRLGIVSDGECAPDTYTFAFGDLCQRADADRLLFGLGGFSDAQLHWEILGPLAGTWPDPRYFDVESQLSLGLA